MDKLRYWWMFCSVLAEAPEEAGLVRMMSGREIRVMRRQPNYRQLPGLCFSIMLNEEQAWLRLALGIALVWGFIGQW